MNTPRITQEDREKAAGEAVQSTRQVCDEEGLGLRLLLRKLKAELNWKETKTMKVKGLIREDQLPKGFRVVATSGTIIRDKEGKEIASDGETIVMWEEKAGGIRQRARMDAHDLRGDYPTKGVKNPGIDLNRPLTEEEREALREELAIERVDGGR